MVLSYPMRPGVCSNPRAMDAGISVWNWGNSFLGTRSAPPNLPPLSKLNLPRPTSLSQRKRPLLRSSMVLRISHGLPLPMASPVPCLFRNLMERCAVQPPTHSISRSGASNVMVPYGSCMLRALAIVASAPCARNVKKAAPRSNRDG